MSARRNCSANWPRCIRRIREKRFSRRPTRSMREKSKAAYMISSVAEQYGVHPQTLRLYEREGLLKPSRSDGNTRQYTEDDLDRLEIILNMRAKMAAMQSQIEEFVRGLNLELANRPRAAAPGEQMSLIPVVRIIPKSPAKTRRG